MKSNYKKIGELIKKVSNNKNTQLMDLPLLGLNIEKRFMPSVANVIGTDMSKYQIINKKQFAYTGMQVGRDESLHVALYENDTPALITPAYTIFEVIDESVILPEYLMLYFRRKESDRLGWFYSDSSVRSNLDWDRFCEMGLNVPSIEKQKKIVTQYNQINEAIKIKESLNNNLEQQAITIYNEYFCNKNQDFEKGLLSDIAHITMGQSPDGSTYNTEKQGKLFYQGRAEFGFRYPKERLYTTEPNRIALKNDILMSVRAPVGDINIALNECCIGRGLAALRSKHNAQSYLFYTLLILRKTLDIFNGEGTVFGSINKDSLGALDVTIPPRKLIEAFEEKVKFIDSSIRKNAECISNLIMLRDVLLPKLMLENS